MEFDSSIGLLIKVVNDIIDFNLTNLASDSIIMFYSFIDIILLDSRGRSENGVVKEEIIKNRIIMFTMITAKEAKRISRRYVGMVSLFITDLIGHTLTCESHARKCNFMLIIIISPVLVKVIIILQI